MGWIDRRKTIISRIRDALIVTYQKDDTCNEEKLISTICSEFGSARRKVIEYIQELEHQNFCTRQAGLIWANAGAVDKDIQKEANEKMEEVTT